MRICLVISEEDSQDLEGLVGETKETSILVFSKILLECSLVVEEGSNIDLLLRILWLILMLISRIQSSEQKNKSNISIK